MNHGEPPSERDRADGRATRWWRQHRRPAWIRVPGGILLAAVALDLTIVAAAGVAAVRPDSVSRLASGAPDWAGRLIPDDSENRSVGSAPTSFEAKATAESTAARIVFEWRDIEGVVSDLRGRVFTLHANEGDWFVSFPATAKIEGEIAEGARVEVMGAGSTSSGLQAREIRVVATPAPDAHAGGPGKSEDAPGQNKTAGPSDAAAPGRSEDAPGQNKTPTSSGAGAPGNSGDAPGLDKTPTPSDGGAPGNSGGAPGQNKTPTPPDGSTPGQNRQQVGGGRGNGSGPR